MNIAVLRVDHSNKWYPYEVDFVISLHNKVRELIQVTYATNIDEIRNGELKALELAREHKGIKHYNPNLTVITWDYEDVRTLDNTGLRVRFVPLWRWLLKMLLDYQQG